MTIGENIISIIKNEILQDESFEIDPSEDLLTSAALDSMALIRLVAAIENAYEIKIPPNDLVIENFINIEAMESYITSRVNN